MSEEDLRGDALPKPAGLPRGIEAVLAGTVLTLLLPLLALLAVLVATTSRGPVLFRQERVGRHGEIFRLVKFRSMRFRPGPEVTSRSDPRITAVGRWLRRSKLDELPELWNVLVGQMSLVGPRPEVPRYVDLDDRRWRLVLSVRPGLTDPTTLWLRNEEALLESAGPSPEEFYVHRLLPCKLDGHGAYLRKRSWRTDLAVLARTVLAIVVPSAVATASMEDVVSVAREE